jgi:hypothetical protein
MIIDGEMDAMSAENALFSEITTQMQVNRNSLLITLIIPIVGGVTYDTKDIIWIKGLESQLSLTTSDIAMLKNVSRSDTELATKLEMIWNDINDQQTALQKHPAPKDLANAGNDYNAALVMLRSSVINFESIGDKAPVVGLGSKPTETGIQDYLKAGNSNLNSSKMYIMKIVNDDIDFKQIYGDDAK